MPHATPLVLVRVLCPLQATKRIWAYIKDHNLPRKGKNIQLDDALAAALRRKTISFGTLAKVLNTEMKDPGDLVDAAGASSDSSDSDGDDSSDSESGGDSDAAKGKGGGDAVAPGSDE